MMRTNSISVKKVFAAVSSGFAILLLLTLMRPSDVYASNDYYLNAGKQTWFTLTMPYDGVYNLLMTSYGCDRADGVGVGLNWVLYDQNKTKHFMTGTMDTGTSASPNAKTTKIVLSKGTYKLRVTSSRSGYLRFSSTTQSYGTNDRSPKSYAGAESLSPGKMKTCALTLTEKENWFSFKVAQKGSYTIAVSHKASLESFYGLYAKLMNSSLDTVYFGKNVPNRGTMTHKVTLSPGTYYLRCSTDHGCKYTVKVTGGGAAETKSYRILSAVNKGYAVEVKGGSETNGANVQLYKKNSTAAQTWKVTKLSNGYYRILNAKSGKALAVKNARAGNKANVVQQTWSGSRAQQWKLTKNSDGTYTITSGLSGSYALDLSGGRAGNGKNVQLYRKNGSKAQKWQLAG